MRTSKITVSIQNNERGGWAYSVNIDGKLFAIGYGLKYSDTIKFTAKQVKKAEKYIEQTGS